jgi:hypothetical protein
LTVTSVVAARAARGPKSNKASTTMTSLRNPLTFRRFSLAVRAAALEGWLAA